MFDLKNKNNILNKKNRWKRGRQMADSLPAGWTDRRHQRTGRRTQVDLFADTGGHGGGQMNRWWAGGRQLLDSCGHCLQTAKLAWTLSTISKFSGRQ